MGSGVTEKSVQVADKPGPSLVKSQETGLGEIDIPTDTIITPTSDGFSSNEKPKQKTGTDSDPMKPLDDKSGSETEPQEEKEGGGDGGIKGDEESGDDKPKQDDTAGPFASLYCPVNNQPHSDLIGFSVYHCPICYQDLSKDSKTRFTPLGNPFGTVGSLDYNPGGAPKPEDEAALHQKEKIHHAVEINDAAGNVIVSEDWNHRFNLEDERKKVRMKTAQPKNAAFKVITVLATTVPTSRHLGGFAIENTSGSILDDPKIAVNVHCIKVVIQSISFIHALKSVVSYDASSTLDTGILELSELYTLVAHHLDELAEYKQKFSPPDAERTVNNAEPQSGKLMDDETFDHVGIVLDYMNQALPINLHPVISHYGI